MTTDILQMLELLEGVHELLEASPEGKALFAKMRAGALTEEEALEMVFKLVQEKGLLSELKQASDSIQELVPAAQASMTLEELQASGRPVMVKTSTGIPQLNPLYEAAILERVSLDGDAPEYRFGPLPADGKPAVPVNTTARDPVVIGMMLDRASEEVHNEIHRALENHSVTCARLLEVARNEAEASGVPEQRALTIAEKNLPAVPVGVPGYESAGKLPALRNVSPPEPQEIANLTEEERRGYTFMSLATTQGRVSSTPVIQKELALALNAEEVEPKAEPNYSVTWFSTIYSEDEISPGFSPVETAINFLRQKIESQLIAEQPAPVKVQVAVLPFNGIPDRRFGWTAHVYWSADE